MNKAAYRLTTDRPVDGLMRSKGDIVHLTAAAYADESRWGGLELDVSWTIAPVRSDAEPAEAEEPAATSRTRRKA